MWLTKNHKGNFSARKARCVLLVKEGMSNGNAFLLRGKVIVFLSESGKEGKQDKI